MVKVAYRGAETPTKPAPAPGTTRGERAEALLIRQLIREAPTGAAAWEVLAIGREWTRDKGGRVFTAPVLMSPERLKANQAAQAVDVAIGTAWGFLGPMRDKGEDIPRSWIVRLCELHDSSQDRLFELDAIERAERTAAGREPRTVYADIVHRASMEAQGYLRGLEPTTEAQTALDAAMARLSRALDGGNVDVVRNAAKRYVEAAVKARYGEGVDD